MRCTISGRTSSVDTCGRNGGSSLATTRCIISVRKKAQQAIFTCYSFVRFYHASKVNGCMDEFVRHLFQVHHTTFVFITTYLAPGHKHVEPHVHAATFTSEGSQCYWGCHGTHPTTYCKGGVLTTSYTFCALLIYPNRLATVTQGPRTRSKRR